MQKDCNGKTAVELLPGDVINIPVGVKHWQHIPVTSAKALMKN